MPIPGATPSPERHFLLHELAVVFLDRTDLNTQTVQEVWNGPVLSGVRKDFGNLDYDKYPVCMSCDWVRRR